MTDQINLSNTNSNLLYNGEIYNFKELKQKKLKYLKDFR